jgi:hypothetical protein
MSDIIFELFYWRMSVEFAVLNTSYWVDDRGKRKKVMSEERKPEEELTRIMRVASEKAQRITDFITDIKKW